MKLWLTPSTEISLRDQIVRQVSLAILSGELAPGARLPSVRAIARQFGLHPNTVSAAYRQLHDEKLVVNRRGSGVYVGAAPPAGPSPQGSAAEARLRGLLARTIAAADDLKLSPAELIERLQSALTRPTRVALVESDPELARLALFEIESTGRRVPDWCCLAADRFAEELWTQLDGRVAAVLPSKAAAAQAALGKSAPLIVLEISPIAASLASHLPPSREHLVAVASHWPRFVDAARGMLIAAGFSADAIVCRDARLPGWKPGLREAAAVICDSLTRTELPSGTSPIVFTLLTAAALEHFTRTPE